MFHEATWRGGVPVLLAGWGVERLAWMDFNDLAVPGLEAAYSLSDPELLAVFVGMPGGPGTGREADSCDDHRLAFLVGKRDRIQPRDCFRYQKVVSSL